MQFTKIIVDAVQTDGMPISLGANLSEYPNDTAETVFKIILETMRSSDEDGDPNWRARFKAFRSKALVS